MTQNPERFSEQSEVLTPEGYIRLNDPSKTEILGLPSEKPPIELILGRNHKIELSRGDDGFIRISIDGFKFTNITGGEGNEQTIEELNFSGDEGAEFFISSDDYDLSRVEADIGDGKTYTVILPRTATNLMGEKVDFTDLIIDEAYLYCLGIYSEAESTDVEIQIGKINFGVAIPEQRLKLQEDEDEDEDEEDGLWGEEVDAMLGSKAAREVYNNFMAQPEATREVGLIMALAAFLYQDRLKTLKKEEFIAMVKGIKAVFPKKAEAV
ncbi:hypothetical protein HZB78_03000 [Candidatus Collierbacteria bacterium]|nr:hypothetical protein [Candidatus Collierbacteria bacterium]